jgi:hypothetical protein
MLHHTVTHSRTADVVVDKMLAVTGSSKVKAPLCNYSTNRDGSISVIAAGTANHGGAGSWLGVKGNSKFFGDEMKNLGTPGEPWPTIQLEAARLAAATLMVHIGQPDADMVCGHKEYAPGRKSDPHSLNMDNERAIVGGLMAGWYWDPKNPQPIDDLDDAKAVNAWQGWSYWRESDFNWDENDPKHLDERNKVVTARLIQELMLQGERIRNLGG